MFLRHMCPLELVPQIELNLRTAACTNLWHQFFPKRDIVMYKMPREQLQKSIQHWVKTLSFQKNIKNWETKRNNRTNCWVTSGLENTHHPDRNWWIHRQSAAQPLPKTLVCRAGFNLLLDRGSSIFINQKSPHSALLFAVQIICLWVLSMPSPAAWWRLHLETPRDASISQPSAGGVRARVQSSEAAATFWVIQIENAGETKGCTSNLHTATPRSSSVFEKQLCERGGLSWAAVPWDIYSKSSQTALQQACRCILLYCNSRWQYISKCAKTNLSGTLILSR